MEFEIKKAERRANRAERARAEKARMFMSLEGWLTATFAGIMGGLALSMDGIPSILAFVCAALGTVGMVVLSVEE